MPVLISIPIFSFVDHGTGPHVLDRPKYATDQHAPQNPWARNSFRGATDGAVLKRVLGCRCRPPTMYRTPHCWVPDFRYCLHCFDLCSGWLSGCCLIGVVVGYDGGACVGKRRRRRRMFRAVPWRRSIGHSAVCNLFWPLKPKNRLAMLWGAIASVDVASCASHALVPFRCELPWL